MGEWGRRHLARGSMAAPSVKGGEGGKGGEAPPTHLDEAQARPAEEPRKLGAAAQGRPHEAAAAGGGEQQQGHTCTSGVLQALRIYASPADVGGLPGAKVAPPACAHESPAGPQAAPSAAAAAAVGRQHCLVDLGHDVLRPPAAGSGSSSRKREVTSGGVGHAARSCTPFPPSPSSAARCHPPPPILSPGEREVACSPPPSSRLASARLTTRKTFSWMRVLRGLSAKAACASASSRAEGLPVQVGQGSRGAG